ncbi:MAG: excinuclease ABC subunit UvrC [Clostridia bacterium]|nr:excinuclease ABC subunit UvrC [Clostridia bacterium]
MFDIKENLRKLPEKPGVYIMRDENNIILYVGKAINLKRRVSSYFRKTRKSSRIEKMVTKIDHFEYIITDNEVEALVLECNLIKKHRPQYNVMLKDDKTYPYIKVTIKETFPRVFITRKVIEDGSKYYGPYTDVTAVKEMLYFVKTLFPLKSCKTDFKTINKNHRPCLNYHIKKCLAPCTGNISKEVYHEMIDKVCDFLSGKYEEVVKKLTDEMNDYSKNMEYEKAASVRDKINSIKKASEKQKVSKFNNEDSDVIGLSKYEGRACVEVLTIRGGKLLGQEQYKFEGVEDDDDEEIISMFLKQFYSTRLYIPKKIVIRYELEDINVIEEWLGGLKQSKVEIKVPSKGENARILDMAEKNAFNSLKNSVTKDDSEAIVLKLYEVLHLSKMPKKIESYDISNLGNENIVGAMITVVNGKLMPNLYRKFKMKYNETQDDVSCTYEMLTRRLNHVEGEDEAFSTLPDLILADGGKNQVGAIKRALLEHNCDVEVVGMIKDNKHKIKALLVNNRAIPISKHPELLKFIFMVQEEVHRFAITYHRSLRSKALEDSELDGIEGVGEKRKIKLLQHFKTIDRIKEATVEELLKVDGMNEKLAENIYKFFNH